MKKLALLALAIPAFALAQSYPSPTFNSVTLQNPLTPANGGTGATSATGTGAVVLSNSPVLTTPNLGTPSAVTLTNGTGLPISTGVSGLGAGVAAGLSNAATGSGSPVFASSPSISGLTVTGSLTATGLVSAGDLASQAANSVLANVTGSTASPTVFVMPSCSTAESALTYTSGTGFTCNTAIDAATLGGATFAAPGPIGSTTPDAGSFTSISASGTVSGAGFTNLLSPYAQLASPAFTGTPTAPSPSLATNTAQLATTAFAVGSVPCRNIVNFGGDPTGATDNSAALTGAIAAQPTGRACVYFPAGKFLFSDQYAYTLPNTTSSLTILGAGAQATTLDWPTNGGLKITMPGGSANSIHIRDLEIIGGAAGTGNAAITLINSQNGVAPQPTEWSDISGVSIHGADGYGNTDYWAYGINITSWSQIQFINDTIVGSGLGGSISGYAGQGIGVTINGGPGGSTSLPPAVGYNFIGSQINYIGTAINIGNEVQGVSLVSMNITGGNIGVACGSGQTGDDELAVVNSQINVATSAFILNNMGDTLLSNNLILVPENGLAAQLSNTAILTVTGNSFHSISTTGTNGLVIASTSNNYPSIITGNSFLNFAGAPIILQSGSSYVNVQSNVYSGNGSGIVNSGTNNTIGGGSQ